MVYQEIIFAKSEKIATITLNRPDKLNAWTPLMGAEMQNAFLDAENDPEVRAIIVTGAGRAYCSGADMGTLNNIAEGRGSARAQIDDAAAKLGEGKRADYRGPFSYLLGLSKPVIGAINGACAGLGFTTALYHDIRIASDKARMGLIFPQRGLAIEHGSSWMLPRIIGLARAAEMAITGRLIDANEALAIGLVHKVVPAEQLISTARALASEIAAKCAPRSVAWAKQMIYEHQFTDLATAMRDEDIVMEQATRSEDFKEAIQAFINKRPARFIGR